MKNNKIISKLIDIRGSLSDIDEELYYFIKEIEDIDEENKDNSILDLDKFIRKLKESNLYTKNLEIFIENYLRFDNGDENQ